MKRLFILGVCCLFVNWTCIVQAQNPSKKKMQTVDLQQRVDSLVHHVQKLQYQLESSEVAQTLLAERIIDVREAYNTVLSDSHSTRNITLMWVALIVGALGVFAPIKLNQSTTNKQDKLIKQMEDALTQINKVQEDVNTIQAKIEKSEMRADAARKQSYTNSLFSRAVNEKNQTRAIRLYSRIIHIDEKFVDAYYNRAIAYYETHNYTVAKKDISHYIASCDNDYKAYLIRGAINTKLRYFNDSMADFESAIALAPNEPDVYMQRAGAYVEFCHWKEAIKDYDKVEAMGAMRDLHYNNRAYAYLKLRKLELALADVNDSITLNDKNPDAYDTRGMIYVKMGKDYYNLAVEDFSRAILLNPRLWDTYENRANVYKAMSRQENDPEKKKYLLTLRGRDLQVFRHKQLFKKEDAKLEETDE